MPYLLLNTFQSSQEFFSKKGFVSFLCLLNPAFQQNIKEERANPETKALKTNGRTDGQLIS